MSKISYSTLCNNIPIGAYIYKMKNFMPFELIWMTWGQIYTDCILAQILSYNIIILLW